LVEFALVAPSFLLLTLGFIQLGLWCLTVLLANIAAQLAVDTAANMYLAQYRGNSWEQADCGGPYWAVASIAGVRRAQDVSRWLALTSDRSPTVLLNLQECGLTQGQEGMRLIRADVTVDFKRIVPLLPNLERYTATAVARPTRFYSY
jgi:hypothetical protein